MEKMRLVGNPKNMSLSHRTKYFSSKNYNNIYLADYR